MSVIITTAAAVTVEGKPFVMCEWGKEQGQLTPAAARQLGLQILESGIEAERDAGFFKWTQDMGMEKEVGAAMLQGLREHREQNNLMAFEPAQVEATRALRETDNR